MDFIRNLFSENGSVSMMRLLSLLCVLTSIGLACFGMLQNKDLSQLSILCGTFLAVGIGGKAMQKNNEGAE